MPDLLVQPILVTMPEPGHELKDVLTLREFIGLLQEEEEYYPEDLSNTKLMITRLRKIFYDQWGWNTELIRGAANVRMRYEVKIMDDPTPHSKQLRRYENNQYQPKHREVVYTAQDRVYPERAGQVPFIYKLDHQEVLLPDGAYCDTAHILAGLDAANHKAIVSPLPNFLHFLMKLFPHVDSNVDIVTWLGDIASSSGDFLFYYLFLDGRRKLTTEEEQHYINIDAPGSDMVGDIDPYVILRNYDVSATKGMRYTDILQDYYFGPANHHLRRASLFCEAVGLKGWNGEAFSNERDWLKKYHSQLRDNVCFQIFSLTNEKLKSVWLPLAVWLNGYRDILKMEQLLRIWLVALKEQVKREPAAA
jgi:hypothetical protein